MILRSRQGSYRRPRRSPSHGKLAWAFLSGRALIYRQLAGVDDDMIAEDYALTRIGREPVRELVMARLAKIPLFSANNEAALNMLTSRYARLHSNQCQSHRIQEGDHVGFSGPDKEEVWRRGRLLTDLHALD